MSEFRRKRPDVRIHLFDADQDTVLRQVEAGKLDMCNLPIALLRLETATHPVRDNRLEFRRSLLPDAMTGFENI